MINDVFQVVSFGNELALWADAKIMKYSPKRIDLYIRWAFNNAGLKVQAASRQNSNGQTDYTISVLLKNGAILPIAHVDNPNNLSGIANAMISSDPLVKAKTLIHAVKSSRHRWVHFGSMTVDLELPAQELSGDKNSTEYQLNLMVLNCLLVGFKYGLFKLNVSRENRALVKEMLKGMPNHSFEPLQKVIENSVVKYMEEYMYTAGGVLWSCRGTPNFGRIFSLPKTNIRNENFTVYTWHNKINLCRFEYILQDWLSATFYELDETQTNHE